MIAAIGRNGIYSGVLIFFLAMALSTFIMMQNARIRLMEIRLNDQMRLSSDGRRHYLLERLKSLRSMDENDAGVIFREIRDRLITGPEDFPVVYSYDKPEDVALIFSDRISQFLGFDSVLDLRDAAQQEMVNDAFTAELNRDYESAERLFRRAAEQNPQQADAEFLRINAAFCLIMSGRATQAERELREMAAAGGDDNAHLAGELLGSLKEMNRNRIMETDDILEKGKRKLRAGEFREAAEIFRTIRNGSQFREARYYLARAEEEGGMYVRALTGYGLLTLENDEWTVPAWRRIWVLTGFYNGNELLNRLAENSLKTFKDDSFLLEVAALKRDFEFPDESSRSSEWDASISAGVRNSLQELRNLSRGRELPHPWKRVILRGGSELIGKVSGISDSEIVLISDWNFSVIDLHEIVSITEP